jgi:hypothetical protein
MRCGVAEDAVHGFAFHAARAARWVPVALGPVTVARLAAEALGTLG